jgi:hypothetical protein
MFGQFGKTAPHLDGIRAGARRECRLVIPSDLLLVAIRRQQTSCGTGDDSSPLKVVPAATPAAGAPSWFEARTDISCPA